MVTASQVMLLCDDIMLQYERGFSSSEIIKRARNLLGERSLSLEDINGLTEIEDNDISLELCGIRMYKVLRTLISPNENITLDIIKLRLLSVRCIHMGIAKCCAALETCLTNESEEDILPEKAEKHLMKSKLDVMRCYISTATKFKSLNSYEFEYACLKYGCTLMTMKDALQFIRKEYGINGEGNEFAGIVFQGGERFSQMILKALIEDNELKYACSEVEELIMPLWDGSLEELLHANTDYQVRTTELLRQMGKDLMSIEGVPRTQPLFFMELASCLQTHLRRTNKMTKLSEKQNEVDDLLIIADLYVQLKDEASACSTLEKFAYLSKSLGEEYCVFGLFKRKIVEFHILLMEAQQNKDIEQVAKDIQANSPPDSIHNKLEEIGNYVKENLKGKDEIEASILIISSCCHSFCMQFGYSDTNIEKTFFSFRELYRNSTTVQSETWVQLLLNIVNSCEAKASWGILLQDLVKLKTKILSEDLKVLCTLLWNQICKTFRKERDHARLLAEYLIEFALEPAAQAFKTKAKLALGQLIICSSGSFSDQSKELDRALNMVQEMGDIKNELKENERNLAHQIRCRVLLRKGTRFADLKPLLKELPTSRTWILSCIHDCKISGSMAKGIDFIENILKNSIFLEMCTELTKELVNLRLHQIDLSPVQLSCNENNKLEMPLEFIDACEKDVSLLLQLHKPSVSLEEDERQSAKWLETFSWNLAIAVGNVEKAPCLAVCRILKSTAVIATDSYNRKKILNLALTMLLDHLLLSILENCMISSDVIIADVTTKHKSLINLVSEILKSINHSELEPGDRWPDMIGISNVLVKLFDADSASPKLLLDEIKETKLENSQICFCLGLIAKALGITNVAELLFTRALDLQLAQTAYCASIYTVSELLGLLSDQNRKKDCILSTWEICKNNWNLLEEPPLDNLNFLGETLWNIGVDTAGTGELKDAKNQLQNSLAILRECKNVRLSFERRYHKLEETFSSWMKEQSSK